MPRSAGSIPPQQENFHKEKLAMKHFQISILLALFTALTGTAFAQGAANFPSKPVTIVSPYPPGNTSDAELRIYQEGFTDVWKQGLVIDYKAGAGGIIANSYVAKAVPDGHTLVYTAATISMLPAFRSDLPYDIFKDLAPVMQTTTKVFVLAVRKDFPANTYEEYIAYARANPGKVTWSTVGAGGALHMTGEWLAAGTGAKLSFIHYKGGAQAEVDLLAGRIDSSPKGAVSTLPQLKAGKLRVLAIITGQPTHLFPGIRTVAERSAEEFGIPNFSYPSWVGVLAPGRTPPAIVEKLNADFGKAIRSPKAAKSFQTLDSVVIGSSAEGFKQLLFREVEHWKKLVKDNNIKIE